MGQSTPEEATSETCCEIERMGVFGEGLFEDSCISIPDSVVSNAVFFTLAKAARESPSSQVLGAPVKCSWHVHILIADVGDAEKPATVLLPSTSILEEQRTLSYVNNKKDR